ncbi:MAG: hypothetical protein GWP09_02315, partial [Nitrospiraceae bacterium]|nr:hypothetical protein [Nitrospiraceae bacterium]
KVNNPNREVSLEKVLSDYLKNKGISAINTTNQMPLNKKEQYNHIAKSENKKMPYGTATPNSYETKANTKDYDVTKGIEQEIIGKNPSEIYKGNPNNRLNSSSEAESYKSNNNENSPNNNFNIDNSKSNNNSSSYQKLSHRFSVKAIAEKIKSDLEKILTKDNKQKSKNNSDFTSDNKAYTQQYNKDSTSFSETGMYTPQKNYNNKNYRQDNHETKKAFTNANMILLLISAVFVIKEALASKSIVGQYIANLSNDKITKVMPFPKNMIVWIIIMIASLIAIAINEINRNTE